MIQHRMSYTVAILVGALVFLVCMVGYLSYTISKEEMRDREERIELVNQANLSDCFEIEELKTHVREEARDDFARLDETLRLLNIRKTPEIEARALKNMEATLTAFAAKPCPRIRPLVGG